MTKNTRKHLDKLMAGVRHGLVSNQTLALSITAEYRAAKTMKDKEEYSDILHNFCPEHVEWLPNCCPIAKAA